MPPLLTPLHVSFYFTISFFLFSSATNVLFASSSFCALISSCLAFLLHRKASKRATEKEKTITVMETVTGGKHATGNRQPSTFRTGFPIAADRISNRLSLWCKR
ncbi:hypothetical protein L1987_60263 [Smallanthus sonchifolius]|uniref:Uncharacterized protein n=1 Tax=Smallanthus sonchifolius TaxID=185202 RepID=A0ACB9D7T9_9ASTR|nr:hypothetical protein L1987_60263 [Smallanthus sonchifolius]